MYMSDKGRAILILLLDSSGPQTIERISDKLNMSPRSVRSYLKEVKEVLEKNGCMLINKPGVGVYAEAGESSKNELKAKLPRENELSANPVLRQDYIVGTLLKNRHSYTIQLLADDLYMSKSTIIKDLEEAEKWFHKHKLTLLRKPNYGLSVEGDEFDLRKAIVFYNTRNLPKDCGDSLETCEVSGVDYRIDESTFKKLRDMFRGIDILKIQDILKKTEEMLGYSFTDEAFINLLAHIAVTMERIKCGREIRIDREELENLKQKCEYGAAAWIIENLGSAFNIKIPADEAGYITIYLLGARTQQTSEETEFLFENLEEEFKELAGEIIKLISSILDVNLSYDMTLLKSLAIHLKPAITRMKYGMTMKNPLLDEIKKEYTSIFGACWATSSLFERKTGVVLNEDEVAFISLHIGGAIARQKRKIKAVVICASGIGTSQLIAGKIEREVPEISVIDVLPYSRVNEKVTASADIIISTVPVAKRDPDIVFISTLVSETDVKKIREAASRIFAPQNLNEEGKSVSDIIREELIITDGAFKTKEEVIACGSRVLYDKGYVTGEFAADVLRREDITSTSIGKGVAIPHGIHEFVIKPAICIIKLKKPIDWSGDEVDIVFVLALKFSDIQETKGFFKYFYNLLNDERVLDSIRKADKPGKIAKTILGKSEDDERNNGQ